MSVIIPALPHAPHTLQKPRNGYTQNSRNVLPVYSANDLFAKTGTGRAKTLEALKNPTTFNAVLQSTVKPSPEIIRLRQQLQSQKITAQELLSSPELRLNFYEYLSASFISQLNGSASKLSPQQRALAEQTIALKSTANNLRKSLGLQPSSLKETIATSVKISQGSQSQQPQFGGLFVGLFTKASKLMLEKSIFHDYKYDYSKYSPRERAQLSRNMIWGGSVAASAAAVGMNKFFAEDAFLTGITISTVYRMAHGIYGIQNSSEATLAALFSKLVTYRLADGAMDFVLEKAVNPIPILGEVCSGLSAFAVHKATAWFFHYMFEHQIRQKQKPGLPESVQAVMSFARLLAASGLDFDGDIPEEHYNKLAETKAQVDPEHYSLREAPAITECPGNHFGTSEHPHDPTTLGEHHLFEEQVLLDQEGNEIGHFTQFNNPVTQALLVAGSAADLHSFKDRLDRTYGEATAKEIFRQAKCKAIATSTIEVGSLSSNGSREISADIVIEKLRSRNLISESDSQTLKNLLSTKKIKPQLLFALSMPLVQEGGLSRQSAMAMFDEQIKSCDDFKKGLNQARNAKEIIQNFILAHNS